MIIFLPSKPTQLRSTPHTVSSITHHHTIAPHPFFPDQYLTPRPHFRHPSPASAHCRNTTAVTLLPKHTAVTLVADRAFGTPTFTDLVTAQAWHYLVRVQGQTRCRDWLKREKQVVALLPPHRNRVKMRSQVFKKHKWRQASVVVFWAQHQQTPLCLVSGFTTRLVLDCPLPAALSY